MHAVASIAQSVEQAAVNRWVLGSSPCRGASEALVGFHPQEPSFLEKGAVAKGGMRRDVIGESSGD